MASSQSKPRLSRTDIETRYKRLFEDLVRQELFGSERSDGQRSESVNSVLRGAQAAMAAEFSFDGNIQLKTLYEKYRNKQNKELLADRLYNQFKGFFDELQTSEEEKEEAPLISSRLLEKHQELLSNPLYAKHQFNLKELYEQFKTLKAIEGTRSADETSLLRTIHKLSPPDPRKAELKKITDLSSALKAKVRLLIQQAPELKGSLSEIESDLSSVFKKRDALAKKIEDFVLQDSIATSNYKALQFGYISALIEPLKLICRELEQKSLQEAGSGGKKKTPDEAKIAEGLQILNQKLNGIVAIERAEGKFIIKIARVENGKSSILISKAPPWEKIRPLEQKNKQKDAGSIPGLFEPKRAFDTFQSQAESGVIAEATSRVGKEATSKVGEYDEIIENASFSENKLSNPEELKLEQIVEVFNFLDEQKKEAILKRSLEDVFGPGFDRKNIQKDIFATDETIPTSSLYSEFDSDFKATRLRTRQKCDLIVAASMPTKPETLRKLFDDSAFVRVGNKLFSVEVTKDATRHECNVSQIHLSADLLSDFDSKLEVGKLNYIEFLPEKLARIEGFIEGTPKREQGRKCLLILMDSPPGESEFKNDRIPADADAYIRTGDKLYYLDNKSKTIKEKKLTVTVKDAMDSFDLMLRDMTTKENLDDAQLRFISDLNKADPLEVKAQTEEEKIIAHHARVKEHDKQIDAELGRLKQDLDRVESAIQGTAAARRKQFADARAARKTAEDAARAEREQSQPPAENVASAADDSPKLEAKDKAESPHPEPGLRQRVQERLTGFIGDIAALRAKLRKKPDESSPSATAAAVEPQEPLDLASPKVHLRDKKEAKRQDTQDSSPQESEIFTMAFDTLQGEKNRCLAALKEPLIVWCQGIHREAQLKKPVEEEKRWLAEKLAGLNAKFDGVVNVRKGTEPGVLFEINIAQYDPNSQKPGIVTVLVSTEGLRYFQKTVRPDELSELKLKNPLTMRLTDPSDIEPLFKVIAELAQDKDMLDGLKRIEQAREEKSKPDLSNFPEIKKDELKAQYDKEQRERERKLEESLPLLMGYALEKGLREEFPSVLFSNRIQSGSSFYEYRVKGDILGLTENEILKHFPNLQAQIAEHAELEAKKQKTKEEAAAAALETQRRFAEEQAKIAREQQALAEAKQRITPEPASRDRSTPSPVAQSSPSSLEASQGNTPKFEPTADSAPDQKKNIWPGAEQIITDSKIAAKKPRSRAKKRRIFESSDENTPPQKLVSPFSRPPESHSPSLIVSENAAAGVLTSPVSRSDDTLPSAHVQSEDRESEAALRATNSSPTEILREDSPSQPLVSPVSLSPELESHSPSLSESAAARVLTSPASRGNTSPSAQAQSEDEREESLRATDSSPTATLRDEPPPQLLVSPVPLSPEIHSPSPITSESAAGVVISPARDNISPSEQDQRRSPDTATASPSALESSGNARMTREEYQRIKAEREDAIKELEKKEAQKRAEAQARKDKEAREEEERYRKAREAMTLRSKLLKKFTHETSQASAAAHSPGDLSENAETPAPETPAVLSSERDASRPATDQRVVPDGSLSPSRNVGLFSASSPGGNTPQTASLSGRQAVAADSLDRSSLSPAEMHASRDALNAAQLSDRKSPVTQMGKFRPSSPSPSHSADNKEMKITYKDVKELLISVLATKKNNTFGKGYSYSTKPLWKSKFNVKTPKGIGQLIKQLTGQKQDWEKEDRKLDDKDILLSLTQLPAFKGKTKDTYHAKSKARDVLFRLILDTMKNEEKSVFHDPSQLFKTLFITLMAIQGIDLKINEELHNKMRTIDNGAFVKMLEDSGILKKSESPSPDSAAGRTRSPSPTASDDRV